ncbi:AAA family ATPase [Pseudomonas entomophila]|uniref:ParA family partition ATPase n=1 Tax=Pseudomonas entomophila TaxID=312306 RepID=UPI0015E32A85|nr:ParA family partition ATPase [Pseudomonas entomophila]MBA1194857.1 AAA family ATPase [Pseudomonas entomophila]
MAARVWTVQNQKGGTTKTTTATNIAACLATVHKKNVLLVDLDGTQGSATDWASARSDDAPPVPCVIMRENIKRDLPRISAGYDYVIIDGVPQISPLTSDTVKIADLVIIPVQPSQYDIWATRDMVQLVKDRQEVTDGLPKAALMVARAIRNTIIERTATEALHGYELPVLNAKTYQSVSYLNGIAEGRSVFDLPASDGARDDIEAVTLELLEMDK